MSYLVIFPDGSRHCHDNQGNYHSDDGPAIINYYWHGEHKSTAKSWWRNGKIHREDGPALEQVSGHKYWYLHGKPINCSSQEEFEKLLKLKAFW